MEIKFINRATGEVERESPPAEGLLKFLYDNPFGKTAVLPIAKRKFISEIYGRKMNKPGSKAKIKDFVEELNIDMSESQKSIDEFETFNDFFYRKLKPTARPIGDGLVSPGDGRLIAFENIADVHQFFVKGRSFTLNEFLKSADLAEKYAHSTMLILRLAPNDYHRFHFPLDGVPSEIQKIKGNYYSVSPYAIANNFTKVFCENKREYCELSTADKGDVLIAPVGATMVGSIFETYQPNQPVEKGDEMGYFAFGGSTVVVFLNKEQFQVDADILKNTQKGFETLVKMGEKIGS
jgi:phosphatidylserine decarboxylase